MEMKCHDKILFVGKSTRSFSFSLRFFVLCAAKAGAHINELADAHTHTDTHTKGQVPLGGIHLMVSTAEPLTSLV